MHPAVSWRYHLPIPTWIRAGHESPGMHPPAANQRKVCWPGERNRYLALAALLLIELRKCYLCGCGWGPAHAKSEPMTTIRESEETAYDHRGRRCPGRTQASPAAAAAADTPVQGEALRDHHRGGGHRGSCPRRPERRRRLRLEGQDGVIAGGADGHAHRIAKSACPG